MFVKSNILRLIILSAILTITATTLRGNYQEKTTQDENTERELLTISKAIDAEVDSILTQFQVDLKKVRKQLIAIPTTNLNRIERRVTIPSNVDPLDINQAMNIMAQRYHGRAIGSENSKEKTVALHIKLDGYILETIIINSRVEQKPTKRKR
jgi:hypothetical protein